jgi:beta-alanine degradation protein BauB
MHLLAAVVLSFVAGAAMAYQEATTQRTPFFENNDVKVWKTIVLPNQPLAMHRHENSRVIVVLRGGKLNVVHQAGGKETYDWESGKAYWLTADPPGQLHADVNTGTEPIEVVVIELKQAK